jgi:DNA-directed RNA polymerase specialized sigma54-like protein
MKPTLQLRLSQHLALTPQLQQSIKLLQLSTVEMQQEIERYLLENPMLERDDDHGETFSSAQQFDSPGNRKPAAASAEEREASDEREQEVPNRRPPKLMTTVGVLMLALLPVPGVMRMTTAIRRTSTRVPQSACAIISVGNWA